MRVFARGDRKPSKMLDEPLFECSACKIVFSIEYIPVFDVVYCPRCAAKLGKSTTLREKYLEVKA